MGMHFGLIAVEAPLADFKSSFSEVWPHLEIAAEAGHFSDTEAIWSWKDANERFVSAANWSKDNPGADVYVFCQDGAWAVLTDFSYVLASDEEALRKLSISFGKAISFVVETTGGTAYFCCYEAGQMRRMIQNVDGEVKSSGTALPEERGFDSRNYYMDETEKLMRAFGLSDFEDLPVVSTAVAVSVIDRKDYSRIAQHIGNPKSADASSSTHTSKPWWKFW